MTSKTKSTTTIKECLGTTTRLATVARDGALSVTDTAHAFATDSNVSLWVRAVKFFEFIFLPEGYPGSVSPDYAQYQVWDTLQALCSSVTGTLSTRAILLGVGVGAAEADVLSGTISWVLRDGTGMVARIAFASSVASDLDNDAKRWRLTADVTNDIGLMLEIMSSHLPRVWFVAVVCVASVFKAITGVAGGSSRASLTQHFAVRGNTADVSAKDGSQETAVNLIGMFLGMAVAALVPADSFLGTSLVFALFTALHLFANYRGVLALVLNTFNRQRIDICLERRLVRAKGKDSTFPTPLQMRSLEGVLRTAAAARAVHGNVTLGASLAAALKRSAAESQRAVLAEEALGDLRRVGFAILRSRDEGTSGPSRFEVAFRRGAPARTVLLAYFAAMRHHVAIEDRGRQATTPPSGVELVRVGPSEIAAFDALAADAEAAGWTFEKCQLRVFDWRVDVAPDDDISTSPAAMKRD